MPWDCEPPNGSNGQFCATSVISGVNLNRPKETQITSKTSLYVSVVFPELETEWRRFTLTKTGHQPTEGPHRSEGQRRINSPSGAMTPILSCPWTWELQLLEPSTLNWDLNHKLAWFTGLYPWTKSYTIDSLCYWIFCFRLNCFPKLPIHRWHTAGGLTCHKHMSQFS